MEFGILFQFLDLGARRHNSLLSPSLLLLHLVQRIDPTDDAEHNPGQPKLVGPLLEFLCRLVLVDPGRIQDRQHVKGQVPSIPKLSSHREVARDGVNSALVDDFSSGLEMLHVLADSHDLAREAELGLDGVENLECLAVEAFAVEVEGEEPREVLDQTETFVAADCEGVISS